MCSGYNSAYPVGKPYLHSGWLMHESVCCKTGGNCRDEVDALFRTPEDHWWVMYGLSWIAVLIWIWFGFNVN